MPKNKAKNKPSATENAAPKAKNAFQLLMDARKISIGTNPDGAQRPATDGPDEGDEDRRRSKLRRNRLAEWNAKKGGDEKVEAERRREIFVKRVLEKRAEHFKSIIKKKPKPSSVSIESANPPRDLLSKKRKLNILDDVVASDEVVSSDGAEAPSESDEFLSSLSPSIRKAESVLSYFDRLQYLSDRKNSSLVVNSSATETKTSSKSKRTKNNIAKEEKNPPKTPSVESIVIEDEVGSENIRSARRSSRIAVSAAARNGVYVSDSTDDESEFSIFSRKKRIKRSAKENKLKKKVIANGFSKSDESPKRRPDSDKNLKLAPLFVKKPSVDPEELKKKLTFLQSGVPTSLKNHFSKLATACTEIEDFPVTVHVQQKSETISEFEAGNLPSTFFLADTDEDFALFSKDEETKCDLLKVERSVVCENKNWIDQFGISSGLTRSGLKNLKLKYPNFPVHRTYKKLKAKFLNCNSPDSSENSSPMWIEKFKPKYSSDIIGNYKSVQNIKKWLQLWTDYCASKKDFVKNRRYSDDSLCDFLSSDSESADSVKIPSKVLLIVGPTGSGKTSAIYAIANELNVEVLEANVSSKRTSKKINELVGLNSVSMFKSGSGSSFQSFQQNSQDGPSQNKMLLMLIDDADLIFDEDDGFVGALTNIIQSANRPLIIVASDYKCNHLQQFMKDYTVLVFKPVPSDLLGPWLDIMVGIETGKVIPGFGQHFLDSNKNDIRSAILLLQFYFDQNRNKLQAETYSDPGTDSDRESLCSEGDREENSDITSELTNKLYRKSNYVVPVEKIFWKSKSSDYIDGHLDIHELANYFENVSYLSVAQSYRQSVTDNEKLLNMPWKSQSVDSLCLDGNNLLYENNKRTLSDIADLLINRIDDKFFQSSTSLSLEKNAYNLWKESNRGSQYFNVICNEFNEVTHSSCMLNRRSLALDYWATLRNIFEDEKERSRNTSKRNNRFYNYLSSLGVQVKDSAFENGYKYFGFKL